MPYLQRKRQAARQGETASGAGIPRFKNWTAVAIVQFEAEAGVLRGKLQAEGIPSVVFPRNVYPTAYGQPLGEYAVLVPRAQLKTAEAVLKLEALPDGLDRADLLSAESDYWFMANLRVLAWPITILRKLWARVRHAGEVSAQDEGTE
ncbi:MAG: hypothetical protein Q7T04_05180 [Dehalococcoidia bacterium]|nr:hypothetical protein [Dehalococcoidia bacterium]